MPCLISARLTFKPESAFLVYHCMPVSFPLLTPAINHIGFLCVSISRAFLRDL